MKERHWMIVTLLAALALAACTTPAPVTEVVPTETAEPTPTETPQPTETAKLTQVPTAKFIPSPPSEASLKWNIIFTGAPCSQIGESCQPYADSPFKTYLIESNGKGLKEATLPVTSFFLPQASPTGRYLAHLDPYHLYLFDYQSNQSTQILDGWPSIAFAHNEKFLAYGVSKLINNEPAEVQVGLVKLDDLSHTSLMTLSLRSADLHLSPDDTRVLIKGQAPDLSSDYIYILDLTNNQTHRVFQAKRIGPIHWMPSGSEIEFVMLDKIDGNYTNTLVRLRPGEESAHPILTLDLHNWIHYGFWSPDGKEFVFSLQPRSSEEEAGIYILEIEKKSFFQILSLHYVTDLSPWSIQ